MGDHGALGASQRGALTVCAGTWCEVVSAPGAKTPCYGKGLGAAAMMSSDLRRNGSTTIVGRMTGTGATVGIAGERKRRVDICTRYRPVGWDGCSGDSTRRNGVAPAQCARRRSVVRGNRGICVRRVEPRWGRTRGVRGCLHRRRKARCTSDLRQCPSICRGSDHHEFRDPHTPHRSTSCRPHVPGGLRGAWQQCTTGWPIPCGARSLCLGDDW